MEVQNPITDGLKHTFKATVPSHVIDAKITERLLQKGKSLILPGFRKGKIPLNILKQRYGDQVKADVLEETVASSLNDYAKTNDLDLAGTPEAKITAFDDKKGLDLDVVMHLMPTLTLPPYEGLTLNKLMVTDHDAAVQNMLQFFALKLGQLVSIEEDRPAKLGDIALMDLEGYVDDKPVDGWTASDYSLEIGADTFIPDFEKQLIGHRKGERFKIEIPFPENHHIDSLAGKTGVFNVTLLDLKQRVPAPIDDELAKELGFKDLNDLTDDLLERAQASAEKEARNYLRRQVLVYLVESIKVPMPENMVKEELNVLWREERESLKADEAKNPATREAFFAAHTPIASARVAMGLVIAKLSNKLNIKIKTQELREAIMAFARRHPEQEKKVYNEIINDRDILRYIEADIIEDKVYDAIIEKATLKDKSVSATEMEEEIDKIEERAIQLYGNFPVSPPPAKVQKAAAT